MYSTRTLAVASTLLSLMVLPGCGRDVSVPAADSVVTPVPLTAEQLRNATYVDILDGPFTLVDSRFEGDPPAAIDWDGRGDTAGRHARSRHDGDG